MKTNRDVEQIAAEMLCPGNGWYMNLNYKLSNALRRASELVKNADGELRSRQVIAALIVSWEMAHPLEEPYIVE